MGQLLVLVDRIGGRDAGAVDPDRAGVRIDVDMDVLFIGDAPVGGRDRLFDGADKLLARDLLLGVQLEQGADEIPTHVVVASSPDTTVSPPKKNVGVTHVPGGHLCSAEYTTRSAERETGGAAGPPKRAVRQAGTAAP